MRRIVKRRLTVLILVVGDAVGILLGALMATWVWFGSVTAPVAFESSSLDIEFLQLVAFVLPLWIGILALGRLYDPDRVSAAMSETGRVARSLSFGVVALILGTYLAKLPGLSRAWTLLFWLFAVAGVLFFRQIFVIVLAAWHRRGLLMKAALIVGSNGEAADIIRLLKRTPEAGMAPMGCLASSQAERLTLNFCADDVPVLGSARDLARVASEMPIDVIVIVSSAFDHDVLARMIAELRHLDVDLHVSSGLFEVLTSRVLVSEIAGVPLITVKGLSLSRGNLVVKRAFDLCVCSALILLGAPLWAAVAIAIKLTSPGPVLYSQDRVGVQGTSFAMLKFRSMYIDAEQRLVELSEHNEASGPLFKIRDDPRVTAVGRWMRKYSIDEFPQLLNVMRGEMSLVGPRPPLRSEVDRYSQEDWRRMDVVPGMTGLWQVSGRSNLTFDEMVRLDLFYIHNWSVGLDVALIIRTVPAVLFARGAY
jgi:exopolysaccharide biosynthesis polyprenyl glycosylphosphotransferase